LFAKQQEACCRDIGCLSDFEGSSCIHIRLLATTNLKAQGKSLVRSCDPRGPIGISPIVEKRACLMQCG
jgi:hypothetical protein